MIYIHSTFYEDNFFSMARSCALEPKISSESHSRFNITCESISYSNTDYTSFSHSNHNSISNG